MPINSLAPSYQSYITREMVVKYASLQHNSQNVVLLFACSYLCRAVTSFVVGYSIVIYFTK